MYGLEKYQRDNEAVVAAKAVRLDALADALAARKAAKEAYEDAQNMDSGGANAVIASAFSAYIAADDAVRKLLDAELVLRGRA